MRIRCPHCHNPIEIIEGSSFREILCSECGSSFSLVGGTDETEISRTGEKTIGHFTLAERLGVGAFGAVWKAKDTQLDRIVAIKIPRKGQLSSAETEQFLREARAAAQLKHPNIVGVHEVGKEGDSVYIVSDYIAGATLKEWLDGKPVPPPEAAELAVTIADALHHAHEQGVVHRDLKPGNVMMDLDGQPHVLDFGLAKRESGEITMTVEGALVGTPAYMSPEQARGEAHDADRRSDVYSLGVILFEMLTGELPFRGEKRMLIVKILTEDPPSLRSLSSQIPRDLDTICLKCLNKEPRKRYETADAVAADLRRYLAGEPIHARPTTRLERVGRWCKRNPRIAGLSSLAVAMLLVMIFGGVYLRRSTDATRLVKGLLQANTSEVPSILSDLAKYPTLAHNELVSGFAESREDSDAKLHAALALLGRDDGALPFLKQRLLDVPAVQFRPVRDLMEGHKDELIEYYWSVATDESQEDRRRFQAACALASYDPSNKDWQDPRLADFLADYMVNENSLRLTFWVDALRPVRKLLTPSLARIFRAAPEDRNAAEIELATNVLEDYASDDVEQLSELILDAEPKQFRALFDELESHGEAAIARLDTEINRILTPRWDDQPLESTWREPSEELVQKVERANGMIAERFAFCQTLPLSEFQGVAVGLGRSGYRPTRLRPYSHDGSAQVAASWTRDGRDWSVETARSAQTIRETDESHRANGFVAVDVSGYLGDQDGQPAELYTGLWVKQQSDNEDTRIYVGVAYEQHKEAYVKLEKAGYKFQHSLQGFRGLDGKQIYCGVKTNRTGVGAWWWHQTVSEFDGKLYLDKIHWDVDPSHAADPETTRQRNEKALADAEAKLDQSPEDLNARFFRGIAYLYLGKNDEALNDLGHCVQQAPEYANSYKARAILYARLGDADAARADLQHYAERTSSEIRNAYLGAVVSAYLGDESDAISRLEALVKENQDNDGMLYDAACAFSIASGVYEEQDATKSKHYADRALALLRQAIAAGYSNYSHIQEDADLDSIRGHEGVVALMKAGNLDLRYAAVWNTSPQFESKQSHGLSPEEHLEQCGKLRDEGYRLSSISAASIDGELVTASVWHRPFVPREDRDTLARRQANAAAAMARLAQHDKLSRALRVTDDPESLTQFVHRCREEGVTTLQLLTSLKLADRNRQALDGHARQLDDRVVFGLLLALGEFSLDELPSDQQQATVDRIAQWYEDDPSSTIHGASGWLLRRWGQDDRVREVDEVARPYDPKRQWFTLAIDADTRTFYQTYVVIPPGEYSMGSPSDERGRDSDEALNRVRLTRPVAILDREITRGEYEASGDRINFDQYSPTLEHPMAGPSWYESVKFCRWLTRQAGFSEADQAYADPSELSVSQYPRDGESDQPKNWPVRLAVRGFRLPTEAEWEIAARAGMRTAYSFGGDEPLLERYAWYQRSSGRQTHIAKELRPNLRGLFDVHGNLSEWCHDLHGSYPLGGVRIDPMGPSSGSSRVFRGGSWRGTAAACRTANQTALGPTSRSMSSGLRVALVPFVPAKQVAEPASEGTEAATEDAERSAEPGDPKQSAVVEAEP